MAAHSSSLFFFFFFGIPQQFEAAYSLPDKETHFSHNLHLKEEPHIPKNHCPIGAAATFSTDLCFTLTLLCCRGLSRALCCS